MKKSRYKETQIVGILKEVEAGRQVKDLCREYGISDGTYYNWKSKYGGMEASEIKKLRDLKEENRRLKRLAECAEDNGVELGFIQPGKPTQNSYVERFNRTFREEILDMYVFRYLSEVREITENWISEYNEERPHESLGNLTPAEYARAKQEHENSNLGWYYYRGGLHSMKTSPHENLDEDRKMEGSRKCLKNMVPEAGVEPARP